MNDIEKKTYIDKDETDSMEKTNKLKKQIVCTYNNEIKIRIRFDGRSTAYQRSLRSQRRNASLADDPLAAVTLTYLCI